MNFFVFIALFGTLAQAWRWPWQRANSKLFSMNCINLLGHGIIERSTRKENNCLRAEMWYWKRARGLGCWRWLAIAGHGGIYCLCFSKILGIISQNYICRRKFKIMHGIWSNMKKTKIDMQYLRSTEKDSGLAGRPAVQGKRNVRNVRNVIAVFFVFVLLFLIKKKISRFEWWHQNYTSS